MIHPIGTRPAGDGEADLLVGWDDETDVIRLGRVERVGLHELERQIDAPDAEGNVVYRDVYKGTVIAQGSTTIEHLSKGKPDPETGEPTDELAWQITAPHVPLEGHSVGVVVWG